MAFSFGLLSRKRKTRVTKGSRCCIVPRLEVLEDRCLPSVLTVMNDHNAGPGSLRAAIKDAQAGDTIRFSSALAGDTITLKTQLTIDKPLDIEGPGAGSLAI